jgi:diguanylate cyclase (GGDEF)-like protein
MGERNSEAAEVQKYTLDEIRQLMQELSRAFEVVRLVDADGTREYRFDAQGNLKESEAYCFNVWGRKVRCVNCISARTMTTRKRMSKFEFINDDIYFAISEYVLVEGRPFALEIVHHVTENTLIGAYGREKFVEEITRLNQDMYIDSLTKARNRRYYDEAMEGLKCQGVLMIDVDRFKHFNDTFGHEAGDLVLRTTAQAISTCIRASDSLVRYGGDEFLVGFEEIPLSIFHKRAEEIRTTVEGAEIASHPDLHITVSIGGVYSDPPQLTHAMMEEADRRLYLSKQKRNTVTIME